MRALAAVALLAVRATCTSDATPQVWAGLSAAGSGVVYFADDSYELHVNGEAWLTSAPTSVHVAGQWFTTANWSTAAVSTCETYTDTDCHGDDLYFFNSTDASGAACCTNCSKNPECGAWTWTGVTDQSAAAVAAQPPSWANRCYIKRDCAGRSNYGGHLSGLAPSAVPGTLVRLGAGPVSGGSSEPYPALGAYTGWRVRYLANSSIEVWTTAKFFAASGLVLFEAAFPDGSPGVATDVPNNTTAGSAAPLREFASSVIPATQYPAFVAATGAAASRLGYLTWAGRFFASRGAPSGGATSALAAAGGGAEGGPIVLFDGGAGTAVDATPSLVISPWTNFKGQQLGPLSEASRSATAGIAGGVSGYVTALPAGHVAATGVVFSAGGGVTDTVHAWGALLLSSYNTTRAADPASAVLTYWTDNGACASCGRGVGEGGCGAAAGMTVSPVSFYARPLTPSPAPRPALRDLRRRL